MPAIEARPPVFVVALNPSAADVQRCNALGVTVIGRAEGPWDGDGWQNVSPADYARALATRLPLELLWGVTLPNEPQPGDSFWMAKAVREIRRDHPQLTVLIGCWGNGWDGFIVPVASLDEAWIVYCAHEYGDPRDARLIMSGAPWMALRHRSWFPHVLLVHPDARLMIGEFGLTQAAAEPPGTDVGWLQHESHPVGVDAYRASIREYAAELARDPYVIGACLYEFCANPQWATFECQGGLEDVWTTAAQSTLQGGGAVADSTPAPKELYDVAGPPVFVLGMETYAAAHPEVGVPVTNQITLHQPDGRDVVTLQETEHKLLVYLPGSQVFALPKA